MCRCDGGGEVRHLARQVRPSGHSRGAAGALSRRPGPGTWPSPQSLLDWPSGTKSLLSRASEAGSGAQGGRIPESTGVGGLGGHRVRLRQETLGVLPGAQWESGKGTEARAEGPGWSGGGGGGDWKGTGVPDPGDGRRGRKLLGAEGRPGRLGGVN